MQIGRAIVKPTPGRARLACVALAAACLAGCGPQSGSLVEVKGLVLLDGQPMTTGTVVTSPDSGRAARGVIGSDGRFALKTREVGPGVDPGVHRVAVVAFASSDPNNPEAPSKPLVPQHYTNPFNSGLTIDAKPGETNEVTLELTSAPAKR